MVTLYCMLVFRYTNDKSTYHSVSCSYSHAVKGSCGNFTMLAKTGPLNVSKAVYMTVLSRYIQYHSHKQLHGKDFGTHAWVFISLTTFFVYWNLLTSLIFTDRLLIPLSWTVLQCAIKFKLWLWLLLLTAYAAAIE